MKKMERVALIGVLALIVLFVLVAAGSLAMAGSARLATIRENDEGQVERNLAVLQPTFTPTPEPKPKVSCPVDKAATYLDELELVLEDWDDLMQVAESTPRISLAPVVRELQGAKRDARRMERPECADYLHELVLVAMEREVDGLIAFLGQESDTIVSQKMQGAKRAREVVDGEIGAFREDPMSAYMASNTSAEALELELETAKPFEVPAGWQNIGLVDNRDLILSIPGGWTAKKGGTETTYTLLSNEDGMVSLNVLSLVEPWMSEFDSDAGRLFALQTALETWGYDYYNEWRAETGIYAQNRGYLVEFAKRYDFQIEIEREVWVVVVTPDGQELLVQMSTERDEFAQIDYVLLEGILQSIRARDGAARGGESS